MDDSMTDSFQHDATLATPSGHIRLFLCGDVMTGRGIDQVLPHPGDPQLHEQYVQTATAYVEMAEKMCGPMAQPVEYTYIWGDALEELARRAPDVRIINLETAVTTSDDWLHKGINYRMHPDNIPCLAAAHIDCCVLANNHVLDWGRAGLAQTLQTLRAARITTAGAGQNRAEAEEPAVLPVGGKGRVLVFGMGGQDSGIPHDWAAAPDRPGVNWLPDFSPDTVQRIAHTVMSGKGGRDLVVASIHWGGNWGYAIPRAQRRFAHDLIDRAGVDLVYGHSSHHPKGIEVYRGKLILYGCGDFLNDYEGIRGYAAFRGDLTLMYFVTLAPPSGRLVRLDVTPMRIRRFRVQRAAADEVSWLRDMLRREGEALGTGVDLNPDDTLTLRWVG
jgi:poly-gamma-glutamate synthesis protein (capsule biosynthesis protein)